MGKLAYIHIYVHTYIDVGGGVGLIKPLAAVRALGWEMKGEEFNQKGITYIQPQPVKHVIAPWIKQSLFKRSAFCIEGSRIRSEV